MTQKQRLETVRAALRARGFSTTRYTWNEVQWREGTSEADPFGPGDWDGRIEPLTYALRTLPAGAVTHVLVYERGEDGELKDIVEVVLP